MRLLNASVQSASGWHLPVAMARTAAASSGGAGSLGSNFPPEHMGMVHEHWRQYEALSIYWHLGLAMVYTFLMFTSLIGNGLVGYAFLTCRGLRTPSNILIFNQVGMDLMMFVNIPWFVVNSVAGHFVGWETGCDVYGFFGSVGGMGSAMNNAIIAFDRYRTIAFPIDGRMSGKQTTALAIFAWIWAMPFSIFPWVQVLGAKYVPEGFLTSCSFDFLTEGDETRFFMATIFTWAYVIPVTLISIFYSKLYGKVREHSNMLAAQAKKMNMKSLASNADADKESAEIKIAKIAFTIFFMFIAGWTPYAVVAFIGAFGDRSILTPQVTMFPAIAAKVVSCIDPWIYALNHPRFRAEIERIVPCLKGSPKRPKTDAMSDGKSVATEATGDAS
ncbi:Short wavelentgh sensitive B opsin [Frankliniella occidentalis]|uniref:Opsin-3 n=1 Tax=Frankliniella occidentalis TaxID=133901 RepID=A0A6J1S398_FRAOC|nr:opsin-3 [Frankliniella occidentalis]KAE8736982.1 Short wavelentgh sensitive B opsin [Frankliniella occidentalis]